MAQLVYTMFITNNRASFHLWKENLIKQQQVSKYYDHGCSNRGYCQIVFVVLLSTTIISFLFSLIIWWAIFPLPASNYKTREGGKAENPKLREEVNATKPVFPLSSVLPQHFNINYSYPGRRSFTIFFLSQSWFNILVKAPWSLAVTQVLKIYYKILGS